MALTAVEEAQLRDLLTEKSALDSLAASEAIIISKLGATKKNLSEVSSAVALGDTDLLFVRQGTTDKSVTASTLAQYLAAELGDTFVNVAGDTMSGALALFGGDTGVTPAQFDNDTSLATTAFVQRALGSHSKNISVMSSTALDSASIGALVRCAGAGPYAVTLPVLSELTTPSGSRITIYCSANSATIQRGSTDNILVNDAGVTSLTLKKGDTLTLVSDPGSGIWIAESGSAQLGYSSSFGSSLAANGYQKLPGGLIIQWGTILFAELVSTANANITFPIAFPNVALKMIASIGIPVTDYDFPISYRTDTQSISYGLASLTGCEGQAFMTNNLADARVAQWFAIGY